MKFRILNVVLLLVLPLVMAFGANNPTIRWWGLGVFILLQLSILYYGVTTISAQYFVDALCNAKTDEKVVALSFDDGPHNVLTPKILETLRLYNVPASFFVIGRNIEGNEDVLQKTFEEGHIIGNHSFCHDFWFDMYSSKKMLDDMHIADNTIEEAIGKKPVLFRPPYGITNPALKKAIKKGRYLTIGWSVRSLDTTIKDKEKLLSRISRRIKPGDIILLHDSMEHTANLLPELIETIFKKGYKIKGIDEMLNIRAYA
ncbi:MAG: polysaccharide deacetylase family protein [Flavipsychrobacter sp.]|jgi:peptidoglycan/xylan/chitin deacetylase (PgdA/CDA1 family)|nr:polysaccharide deacetylase family protein [Flavipsychrobacter sp.]